MNRNPICITHDAVWPRGYVHCIADADNLPCATAPTPASLATPAERVAKYLAAAARARVDLAGAITVIQQGRGDNVPLTFADLSTLLDRLAAYEGALREIAGMLDDYCYCECPLCGLRTDMHGTGRQMVKDHPARCAHTIARDLIAANAGGGKPDIFASHVHAYVGGECGCGEVQS